MTAVMHSRTSLEGRLRSLLMRMLVTDRDSYLKNDTVRRSASCETIPQG